MAWCAAVPAAAQSAPPGQGLDLLLIVDRSESMPDRPAAALLLHLALDIVARNGRALRLHHRIGVIGFGSTVSTDMPLTAVESDDLPRLHRTVDTLPTGGLGDTDVLAALTAAERLLRALPADPARRRAIVVLTDGVPFVRGADMEVNRRELQRFATTRFRGGDPTVDVLLLASPAVPRYAALWRALSFDRVRIAGGDRASLLAEAHRTITRLVGTSSSESLPSKTNERVELLVVPPYLDVLVLDIFHSSASATVEIFPSGAARPLKGGGDGVESVGMGDVLSTLVVHRPVAGAWTIRKSAADARVRILSQQFFPKGVLVRPAIADAVRQHDPVRVAYSVVDVNGRGLEELPNYKLSLELALTRPDGTTESVPMERRPELAGTVFAAVRESDCAFAGRYWTTVRVTSLDADGNRIDVFRDRWSGFSVAPATRVDCRVTAAGQQWMPGVLTRVKCVGSDRHPIEIAAFARAAPDALFQPLLLHENARAAAALDLRYLGGGAFSGVLRGAERTGAYRLQLAVDRSRVLPAYNVRMAPDAVAFVRRWTVMGSWAALATLVAAVVIAAFVSKQLLRSRVLRRESASH